MSELGANIKTNHPVEKITQLGDAFLVSTKKGDFKTISVLIASGKHPRHLNIPGEAYFKNKGVGYCAICDGPLYANKDVAIIGGGNSALDAASQLMNIVNHVYVINKNKKMRGDARLLEQVAAGKNVTIMYNTLSKEIKGERIVNSLVMNTPDGEQKIDVHGVFVQIGLIPNSQFIDIVDKNEYGEILYDRVNRTNVPGIFAAGDVTDVSEKQIIIAAGEGAKAALEIFKYVMKKKR